ncbi:ABC transporter substrate-binding protein, partial [Burkholderia sp. SIMBA_013]
TEPGVNRDENTDTVMLHIVEGLVAHREDASVGPLLAREVKRSDDGMTYTFTLRDGVHFQNGATLTAQDVKWTWERYLNPKT